MPPRKTVLQVLTDDALWGRNMRAVLAQLEGFHAAGERRIAVFQDKVVGERKYKSPKDAEQGAREVTESLAKSRTTPSPLAKKIAERTQAPPLELKARPQYFLDDESTRVAVESAGLLAKDLRVATVKQRLGPPQRVTTELIESEGERRPVVLTLYHYAGGAVMFAESDIAARPGFVNRVLIDVPATIAALTKEVR